MTLLDENRVRTAIQIHNFRDGTYKKYHSGALGDVESAVCYSVRDYHLDILFHCLAYGVCLAFMGVMSVIADNRIITAVAVMVSVSFPFVLIRRSRIYGEQVLLSAISALSKMNKAID